MNFFLAAALSRTVTVTASPPSLTEYAACSKLTLTSLSSTVTRTGSALTES